MPIGAGRLSQSRRIITVAPAAHHRAGMLSRLRRQVITAGLTSPTGSILPSAALPVTYKTAIPHGGERPVCQRPDAHAALSAPPSIRRTALKHDPARFRRRGSHPATRTDTCAVRGTAVGRRYPRTAHDDRSTPCEADPPSGVSHSCPHVQVNRVDMACLPTAGDERSFSDLSFEVIDPTRSCRCWVVAVNARPAPSRPRGGGCTVRGR
jgi:hypothetical protein